MKTVTVTIHGMTAEQAKQFAHWYEGQGEQDASVWFEIHNIETPITDVRRKGGFMKVDKEGNVEFWCK